MYFGIDIGYGWTKCCYATEGSDGALMAKSIIMASAIAGIDSARCFKNDGDDALIHYDSNYFLAGDEAVVSPTPIYGRDLEHLFNVTPLLFYKAIRHHSQNLSGHTVGVGLPPGDYARHKNNLAQFLQTIVVNGETLKNDIRVFPQTAAAVLEWISSNRHARNILLVDAGYNALHVVPVINGKPQPKDSRSISYCGISWVADRFADVLRSDYGLICNHHEVSGILQCGKLIIFGRVVDVSEHISCIMSGYIDHIMGHIKLRWNRRLNESNHLVLLGGGANLILQYLPEKYKAMIRVMYSPEFVNARAFLMLTAKRRCKFENYYNSKVLYPIRCQTRSTNQLFHR